MDTCEVCGSENEVGGYDATEIGRSVKVCLQCYKSYALLTWLDYFHASDGPRQPAFGKGAH